MSRWHLLKRGMEAQMGQIGQGYQEFSGLRIAVCGSASPLGSTPERAQACIAVITPDHFFIIDVGANAPTKISSMNLPVYRLQGIFLTHFHSDHISDIP